MATHKLIPYWIQVRKVEEPDTAWDLTSIHTHEPKFPNNNLADYFEDFIKEYKGESDVYKDEDEQKTFTVANPVKRKGNTIEGRFKSGEWGQNADFWDVDKHKRIEDARKENHSEEIPYYFFFHIPDTDRTQALLLLSKYKRKGVKTLFSNLFYPDEEVGDAYMTIEPHYSDKIIEKINEADRIAAIKFRGQDGIPAREQYADTKDIENLDDDFSGQLEVGSEWKITPKGNQEGFLEYAKEIVSRDDTDEVKNFDYGRVSDFESASITVVEGESELTFPLWKEEIQMRVDLDPDEYNLEIYGDHPTPYSIGCAARQVANDLLRDWNTDIDTESLIPQDVGVPEDEEEGDRKREETDQVPAPQG
ncbi:hypothetical protein [Natrinema salifodinae]|uniref:Uncharacterized protein n=1 Tax=Natrinema salifodinae TaxID=1202768 RepID=A0A1I0NRM8_9EURY|nr:hypothetical protein [Natrinema salifodinae]SEW04118.1 hypothetical protein SAMN05216285_2035 [Natrinema salifodinae]